MVRYEALKEARAQAKALKESYKWLPEAQVPTARAFFESYQQDPIGTLVGQLEQLLQHPTYGPKLQALAGQHGQQGAQPSAEPEPDFVTQDGVPVRSAQNQAEWYEWKAKQDREAYESKLRPMQEYMETQQRTTHLSQLQQQATDRAHALMQPYEHDQYFQQHRDAIRARFREYVGEMPGEAALHRAYAEILREDVLPGMSRTAREDVVQSLNRKPGATGPNPSRPATAAPRKKSFGDFREALESGVLG